MQASTAPAELDEPDELGALLDLLNSGSADVLPFQILEIEEVVDAMPEAVKAAALDTSHPIEFAEKIIGLRDTPRQIELGIPWYTKAQEEIWDSIVDNQYTLVLSGNSLGKTFVAAITALWLYYRGYRVITTAPTARQVKELLWTEIRTLKALAEQNTGIVLAGNWAEAACEVRDPGNPKHTLMGYTARVRSGEAVATNFQGTHYKLMAVIVDEGIAVERAIFEAIDRLVMADPSSRVLVIGNPTDQQAYAYELENMRHPEGHEKAGQPIVHTIHVSAEDHPNVLLNEIVIPGAVTKGFVDLQFAKGGTKNSAWYRTSVQGLWPGDVKDALIQMGWIVEAKLRTERQLERDFKALAAAEEMPESERAGFLRAHFRRPSRGIALGLDVAGEGDNLTVLTGCEDNTIFYPKLSRPCWHVGKDHTEAVELVFTALRELKRVRSIAIDDTGLGAAVSAEISKRRDEIPGIPIFIVKGPQAEPGMLISQTVIYRINFGGTPVESDTERLAKMRDSLYWEMREALRPTSMVEKLNLPTDEQFRAAGFPPKVDLFAQLSNPITWRDRNGLLHVLDKRDSEGPHEKTKNLPTLSPDLAHSACLAKFAAARIPESQAAPETAIEYFEMKVQAMKAQASVANRRARQQQQRVGSAYTRRAR